MTQQLATSGKVITALAVLEGDEDLFRYGPAAEEATLSHFAGVLKSRFARDKRGELATLLRSWSEQSPALPIHEIHPGWILEVVQQESPRVLGLICRYLPGSHVRYLLEHLPRTVRNKLPTLSESFALPDELLENVKTYLNQQFFHSSPPSKEDRFSCQHIPWMSGHDLRELIRELGYEEIRHAFVGVDPRAAQTFLTRFPIEEAVEIRRRLESGRVVSTRECQRAREHIVTMKLEVRQASDLPFEIGLSVLATTVIPADKDWIEGVVVRLAPHQGYQLRRLVHEAIAQHRPDVAAERQKQLLGLIRDMAEQGRITRYWRPQPDEETTKSGKGAEVL